MQNHKVTRMNRQQGLSEASKKPTPRCCYLKAVVLNRLGKGGVERNTIGIYKKAKLENKHTQIQT
jgi:hypothetical protein